MCVCGGGGGGGGGFNRFYVATRLALSSAVTKLSHCVIKLSCMIFTFML